MYNILHLDKIFDYFDQFNIDPYLNILNHPNYFNVRVLPDEQKKQAKELLISYKHKPKVEGLINYLEEDWSHLYDTFLEKTKIIDEVRKIR
jgi:tRNA(His) 5'-end guanylyltransferase